MKHWLIHTFLVALLAIGCAPRKVGFQPTSLPADPLWAEVDASSIPCDPAYTPTEQKLYRLNYDALYQSTVADTLSDTLFAELPLPDGRFVTFRMIDSGTMSPALARKYPELRSWRGEGIRDKSYTVRLDHSQKGYRASIRTHAGTALVEPYCAQTKQFYVAFYKGAHPQDPNRQPYDEND